MLRQGDLAELSVFGVSSDSRYIAFEEFGVMDGGPVHYSRVVILDAEANAWAATPVDVRIEGDSGSLAAVRAAALERAEPLLRRFGITRTGSYGLGGLVVNHLFSDTGVDPHVVEFAVGASEVGQYSDRYVLRLTEADAGHDCDYFGRARMMTLTIAVVDNGDHGQETELQRDDVLPASRGCALAYRIERVYILGPKFVVAFLNVMIPGFEGRSMRYMAVGGTLPDKA
jgi:predicted secreted protein